jgi:hypothetical protein
VTGKIQKTLFYTFALSPNFSHRLQKSTRSQITLIYPWINLYSFSQKELLIHKPLSLITKTRIRGLDAFTVPESSGGGAYSSPAWSELEEDEGATPSSVIVVTETKDEEAHGQTDRHLAQSSSPTAQQAALGEG